MSDWPFVRAVKRTKPSRKAPEGVRAQRHWANWLPVTSMYYRGLGPGGDGHTVVGEGYTTPPLLQSVELGPVGRLRCSQIAGLSGEIVVGRRRAGQAVQVTSKCRTPGCRHPGPP